jgi:hypothetical protein
MTMRTCAIVAAIGAALLLGPSLDRALAQGRAGQSPQSDRPTTDIPGSGAGGRVVPPDTEPPAAAREEPPAPPVRWNSVAAGIWRVRGRVHVAIGYSGARSSAEDATSSAVDACVSGGGRNCKALGAWNSGCAYITTGHAVNRAGWASGATIEAALKKCRGDGFSCKPPIGGCVE